MLQWPVYRHLRRPEQLRRLRSGLRAKPAMHYGRLAHQQMPVRPMQSGHDVVWALSVRSSDENLLAQLHTGGRRLLHRKLLRLRDRQVRGTGRPRCFLPKQRAVRFEQLPPWSLRLRGSKRGGPSAGWLAHAPADESQRARGRPDLAGRQQKTVRIAVLLLDAARNRLPG
jgi:hypothetical protein